jgi:diadenosine tetraphosphate (Ap4A) HIT family hydrolase
MTEFKTLIEALEDGTAPWNQIEFRTKDYWVFKDGFPVTEGHLLFVPTNTKWENLKTCFEAAYKWGYRGIDDEKWDAFNVGQNVGKEAGQTVMYPHIHLIPRRKNDCDDPTGGVRNCISGKGNYKKFQKVVDN